MSNLYMILDATNPDYRRLINALHAKVQDNFSPRLRPDGTQALIQVKDRYLISTLGARQALAGFVLDSGDEAWARRQVSGREWQSKEDD